MTLLMVQKSCKPDKVGSLSHSLLVNLYIPGDQFRISEPSQAVTGDNKNQLNPIHLIQVIAMSQWDTSVMEAESKKDISQL